MSVIEQERLAESATSSRRAFSSRALGLIAGVSALLLSRTTRAEAGLSSPCCDLASFTQCDYAPQGKCYYSCPSGYNKTYWWCQAWNGSYNAWVGCGECSAGATCTDGPWACSIWWWSGSGYC